VKESRKELVEGEETKEKGGEQVAEQGVQGGEKEAKTREKANRAEKEGGRHREVKEREKRKGGRKGLELEGGESKQGEEKTEKVRREWVGELFR
jgi:hypothetical protein